MAGILDLFAKWASRAYAGGIGASRATSEYAFKAGYSYGRKSPRFQYVLYVRWWDDVDIVAVTDSKAIAVRWAKSKDPKTNRDRCYETVRNWRRFPKEDTDGRKKLRQAANRRVRQAPAGKR